MPSARSLPILRVWLCLQWEQEREELKETMKSKVNEMRNISSIFDGICDRLDAALSRGLLDTFNAVMKELISVKQMAPQEPQAQPPMPSAIAFPYEPESDLERQFWVQLCTRTQRLHVHACEFALSPRS